ncbi:MAG TPA: peptidoglycan recognition family protein [Devosiaceae bacterium]|nr:peptidoglycan recognition family protein [Devosiaceae bacterium]
MHSSVPRGAATSLVLPPLKQVASPNHSSRNGAAVRLIVVHDCEGSYGGSISWFSQKASQVSAHIVLREDGSEATQMVPFANKAWHAVAFNSASIGVEMAGYTAKGFAAPEWQAAANIIAFLLHKFDLPCRWAEGGAGQGFCSHFDLGKAGGGHSDPTTDPKIWAAFVARVEAAYALPAPADWVATPFVPTTTTRKG